MCHYEKHMVGYLDILGATSYIKADSEGSFLQIIHQCYMDACEMVDLMSVAVQYPFQTKIFSDNIIIALPCAEEEFNDNHPIIALNRMAALMCALQRYFLSHHILSRGSITYGDLFIDDLLVFGDALIEAYHLEDKISVFPRVILSREAQRHDLKHTIKGNEISSNKLRVDSDGFSFLDYLNYPEDKGVQSLVNESLYWVKVRINEESDERILQKLQWHLAYLKSLNMN